MRHTHPLKLFLFLAIFLLPVGISHAQNDPGVEYLRYDVDITLEESGDFIVREIQQVRYNGEFREGFAEIPLDYVTDISDIAVYGGFDLDHLNEYEFDGYGPDTFSLEKEGDILYVDWEYEPTATGDELTFVVEYLVEGGLWIYPEADLLEWRAVPADRSGLDVPASRVAVNLPFPVKAEDLDFDAFGPAFTVVTQPTANGQQLIFTTDEPLPDGTPFQILVEFPHGLVRSVPQAWQLAEDEAELVYRIPAVDVVMELDEQGNLHVTERQQVRVVEGTMYEGFRRFTWLFLEGLDRLFVREGDVQYAFVDEPGPLTCEDCFTISFANRPSYWVSYNRYDDEIDIKDYAAGGGEVTWRFPPLVKGEETTFELEYTAAGVVSINEEDQKLHWTILPGYDVPVEQTTVHLSLPDRLGLEDVVIEGAGSKQAQDGVILLTLDEPATDWSIQVTLPVETTSAAKPAWQFELEEVAAEVEAYRERLAREKIIIGSGALLAFVLTILGVLAAWYLKGSRKWREIRGNYRTTPPSDLAPGLVAYLVDEKATAKGALATLLHLATVGLIRIDLQTSTQIKRVSDKEQIGDNALMETPLGKKIRIAPHIAYLYNSLAHKLPVGHSVPLDDLLGRVKKLLPGLYTKMGQDLVVRYHQQGDLNNAGRLPKRAFFLVLGLVLGLFLFTGMIWNRFFITPLPGSGSLIVVTVIILFVFLAWWIISTQRSSSLAKSAKTEAIRWLGFKAYLQDIQKYGDLVEAQEILDRYFDYAVALNVDQRLLQQIKLMGGVVPVWLGRGVLDDGTEWEGYPGKDLARYGRPRYGRPWYRRGSWLARPPRLSAPDGGAGSAVIGDGRPALQRLSEDLNGSLSRANESLTGILNTAVGEGSDPIKVKVTAFGSKREMEFSPQTPVDQVIGDIMRQSQTLRPPRPSRSSGGGFRGGSSGSRRSSRSGGRSRSSGSRRSGGGGRRGFR